MGFQVLMNTAGVICGIKADNIKSILHLLAAAGSPSAKRPWWCWSRLECSSFLSRRFSDFFVHLCWRPRGRRRWRPPKGDEERKQGLSQTSQKNQQVFKCVGAERGYLQAAENGKQVVEDHHVTIDCHQTKQPGGADKQKEDEGHAKSRAVDEGKHAEVKKK